MGVTTSFYALGDVKSLAQAIKWVNRDDFNQNKAVAEVDIDKADESIRELIEDLSEEAAEVLEDGTTPDEIDDSNDMAFYSAAKVAKIAKHLPTPDEAAELGPDDYVFHHYKGFYALFKEAAKRKSSVLKWSS